MKWNTPIEIAGARVHNRIVFPAVTGNWAEIDGSITEKVHRFYKDIAEGGCGMVVVSGTAVAPEGRGTDRSLCLFDNKHMPGFRRLADTIKKNGCLASIQLMHSGGQGNPAFTGHRPVSPSGVRCEATGYDSQSLTTAEVADIKDNFINSAALAYRAGFESVELHLAHGYLLHEFLSGHTNRRSDLYGGTIRERARLVLRIIEGIKTEAPEIIIGVRVSGEDYIENGINEDANKELLPILQDAGVEYFSVTAGIYDSSKLKHAAMGKGLFFDYARGIRDIISKPVIGVGKILDLTMAEDHLQKADCDMVAIGRGLIADPKMVSKTLNGQAIDLCTECDQCHFLRNGTNELSCPVREVQYA